MAGYPGKQGRKPTPTALKILRGNPGRRPLNHAEPQVRSRLPPPPAHLSEAARRNWRAIGKMLRDAGIITPIDAAAFGAGVAAYTRWQEATEALNRLIVAGQPGSGLLVKSPDGGVRLNPLLRVIRESEASFLRVFAEFGMTPSSRSRIAVDRTEPEDPFATWERSAIA